MQTIVLAGGYGTRLQHLTKDIPKALLEINGKPIIYYILQHLSSFETENITIAVGYKAEKIINYLKIHYNNIFLISNAGESVSMIDRIKTVVLNVPADDFLVCYGDTICDVDIKQLRNQLIEKNANAVFSTIQLRSSFGHFDIINDGEIIGFNEKTLIKEPINIGYSLFSKKMIRLLEISKDYVEFINKVIEIGGVYEFRHTGQHITVNTLDEYEKSKEALRSYGSH